MNKASSVAETKNEESRHSGAIPKGSSPDGERAGSIGKSRPVESGVFSGLSQPVATEQLLERLQSALGVASKGESELAVMQQSLHQSTSALTASRQAQQSLAEELRVLYRGLNELLSEKAGLERYSALLSQERDAALSTAADTRREAKKDRQFLLNEQDRFIRLLMEEHEAELALVGATLPASAPTEQNMASLAALGGASAVLAEAALGEISSSPAILPPPSETTAKREKGDWDPQDWAVSTQLMRDEPVAAQLLRQQSKEPNSQEPCSQEQEYPEEVSIHEEPAQVLLAQTPLQSATVARIRLKKVTAGELEAARQQASEQSSSCSDESPTAETLRSETPPAVEGALLDLESLAEEVDGNSDRPPPVSSPGARSGSGVRKVGISNNSATSKLTDTLVSGGVNDPGTQSKD